MESKPTEPETVGEFKPEPKIIDLPMEVDKTIHIKGSIGYTIDIHPNNNWAIVFDPGLENEIVAAAICRFRAETVSNEAAVNKKTAKRERKKELSIMSNKYRVIATELQFMLSEMQNLYYQVTKNKNEIISSPDENITILK